MQNTWLENRIHKWHNEHLEGGGGDGGSSVNKLNAVIIPDECEIEHNSETLEYSLDLYYELRDEYSQLVTIDSFNEYVDIPTIIMASIPHVINGAFDFSVTRAHFIDHVIGYFILPETVSIDSVYTAKSSDNENETGYYIGDTQNIRSAIFKDRQGNTRYEITCKISDTQ